MPKLVKPLTDTQIRNAKPKEKPYKLFDGKGLYIEIMPTGTKLWRYKFRRPDGRENRLSFGCYPEIELDTAREKRLEARRLAANGVDLADHRAAIKVSRSHQLENSFEAVALEWLAKNKAAWAKSHSDKILGRLENDVFPYLGQRSVASITAPDLLAVIRRIEARGVLETAHRALSNCGQIFRYAVATGRADRDPSGDLRGALPSAKSRRKHMAALTEPTQVAGLLRMLDDYQGTATVRAALRLAPLVFVRPGELRAAEWAHIDLDRAEWRYIVNKTKTRHIVPLSRQAIAILRELYPLTGRGRYLFPSPRSKDRPMSDNAVLSAMRRMGVPKEEMSGHGFRALARTILDEILGFPPHLIEHQLAHAVRDPLGRSYNRTTHLPQRKEMMQAWGDYLDRIKTMS